MRAIQQLRKMGKRGTRRLAMAGVAVALVAGAQAAAAGATGPSYLAVSGFNATAQNDNLVKLSLTTGGAIPRRADNFILSNPVVGFAWADLNTGKVFVATIHPALGRDSLQNPSGWHAHTATVGPGATAPHDFCVVSIDSTPTAGIAIHGNTMVVEAHTADLPMAPQDINAAAGFTLQGDTACASGLAVQLSN